MTISFLLVGVLLGALVSSLAAGRHDMGAFGTIALSTMGAYTGGVLAMVVSNDRAVDIVGAVGGAVLVVAVFRALASPTHP